ncbi:hypothetical protein K1Y74_21880, partial [Escherichia coli]|nr:hypothetical protein [Escherichia coli]MBZ9593076.1 hypothetical protein [Escherichia coli]
TFGAQFKNDGHYFCRAGGNRPDGLNEPVTDVAMGTDYQVADILASQHDCKQRRGSQLPVNLKTCP